jgi:excisionase family DNA binding protein
MTDNTATTDDRYVTTAELSRMLGVRVETVLIWARKGLIPHIRLGYRTIRYPLADVMRALEAGATLSRTRGAGRER